MSSASRVKCVLCHRSYSLQRLRNLRLPGFIELSDGAFIERRVCTCQHELGLEHEKPTADELALLEFVDIEIAMSRPIAIRSNKRGRQVLSERFTGREDRP